MGTLGTDVAVHSVGGALTEDVEDHHDSNTNKAPEEKGRQQPLGHLQLFVVEVAEKGLEEAKGGLGDVAMIKDLGMQPAGGR